MEITQLVSISLFSVICEEHFRIFVNSFDGFPCLDDHSRVVLSGAQDYINANFIKVTFCLCVITSNKIRFFINVRGQGSILSGRVYCSSKKTSRYLVAYSVFSSCSGVKSGIFRSFYVTPSVYPR